jgi:hypothetical protein
MTHEARLRFLWTKLASGDQLELPPPKPRPDQKEYIEPFQTREERTRRVLGWFAEIPSSRQAPGKGPIVSEMVPVIRFSASTLRTLLPLMEADGLLWSEQIRSCGRLTTHWYITDAGLDRLVELESKEGAA